MGQGERDLARSGIPLQLKQCLADLAMQNPGWGRASAGRWERSESGEWGSGGVEPGVRRAPYGTTSGAGAGPPVVD